VHLAAEADASRAHGALIDAIDQAAARQRGAEAPLDRKQLARTLEQLHATLVEYAAGSRDMFAFVMTGGALRVVHLGNRSDIASAVGQLRDLLRDSEAPASDVRAAAERLAGLVLWPLGRDFAAKRIIFVPTMPCIPCRSPCCRGRPGRRATRCAARGDGCYSLGVVSHERAHRGRRAP